MAFETPEVTIQSFINLSKESCTKGTEKGSDYVCLEIADHGVKATQSVVGAIRRKEGVRIQLGYSVFNSKHEHSDFNYRYLAMRVGVRPAVFSGDHPTTLFIPTFVVDTVLDSASGDAQQRSHFFWELLNRQDGTKTTVNKLNISELSRNHLSAPEDSEELANFIMWREHIRKLSTEYHLMEVAAAVNIASLAPITQYDLTAGVKTRRSYPLYPHCSQNGAQNGTIRV